MKVRVLCLLGLGAALMGCSAAKPHLAADEYFRQANDNFRHDALNLAIEQYHELLDQYPFSDHNEEAELKIAHAQYLAANYAEAIVALTDFQRRHPTSPQLPFVGYYLGMCYVQQMSTIDRDQTATQNAQTYFLTVSRQYPDSPFAELAREQLAHCREDLARHELYVANFYERRGGAKAAEIRLLGLATHYGDTKTSASGLLRLARLYRRQGQNDHAWLAYSAVTQIHPGSTSAITAQRALQRLANEGVSHVGDPLDTLLAENGRRHTPGALETVQLPGIDLPRVSGRPSGAPGPALGPSFDPFGRGRGYY